MEGRRLARIVFRRRLNRETIPLTEQQFAEYLAMMFEAGALRRASEKTNGFEE